VKIYVQLFLISVICLKGLLISAYLLQEDVASLIGGSVALAVEPQPSSDQSAMTPTPDDAVHSGDGDRPADSENVANQGGMDLTREQDVIAEREAFLARREKQLLALQEDINLKIETLTQLRNEIRGEIDKRDEEQENQVKHLIKIYSNMKPQKVAELIEKMDIDLITALFSRMKGDVVGKILSFTDIDTGAKISQRLFPQGLEAK